MESVYTSTTGETICPACGSSNIVKHILVDLKNVGIASQTRVI